MRNAWLCVFAVVFLGCGAAWGATINVTTTEQGIVEDGLCSFLEAVDNANDGAIHIDCVAGEPGLDVIELGHGETYNFTHGHYDESLVFRVHDALTILGNGSTVQRDSSSDLLKRFIMSYDRTHLAFCDITFRQWEMAVIGGPLWADHCTFSNNEIGVLVLLFGSSLTLMDCTFDGNDTAVDVGYDYGIWETNTVRLVRCNLTNNVYGLYVDPGSESEDGNVLITVDDCWLSNNGRGVTIWWHQYGDDQPASVRALLRQTTINGGELGVMISGPAEVEISNCTISYNIGSTGAGIDLAVGRGSELGTVTVSNSTLWHNDYAVYHRESNMFGPSWRGRLTLQDSVIAGSRTNCYTEDPDEFHLESSGFNVTDDESCDLDGPTDLFVSNVRLSELGDYGGPTPVHMPLEGSPAIDISGECSSRDQRGYRRPADGDGDGVAHCDCGAVEVGGEPPVLPPDWPPQFPNLPPHDE